MSNPEAGQARVLILTVPHGASHQRAAQALQAALREAQPGITIEIVDALALCTRWFRAYYNSYEIPLRYWPGLWGWIESRQHEAAAPGPPWLYRLGGKPLFRFLRASKPDIVIATEVGVGGLAAMFKREGEAQYFLAASCGLDADRAWVQPEMDLYILPPGDPAAELERWGAPKERILPAGMPVNPEFARLPDQMAARERLGLSKDLPVLLVLFGGAGFGKPERILPQLASIAQPHQQVFIAGRNTRLLDRLRRYCMERPHRLACGWVDNVHEWMAAADLLLSKPGASTLNEAINAGLPILAMDPLPGNEQRFCAAIEKWEVGAWVRQAWDLAAVVERLLADRGQRGRLRKSALARARPEAAREAAEAILQRWAANMKGEPWPASSTTSS